MFVCELFLTLPLLCVHICPYFLQVHLELGNALKGVDGCEVDCCHLFACARQGSTTMLVIDIGSLREVGSKLAR